MNKSGDFYTYLSLHNFFDNKTRNIISIHVILSAHNSNQWPNTNTLNTYYFS